MPRIIQLALYPHVCYRGIISRVEQIRRVGRRNVLLLSPVLPSLCIYDL